MIATVIIPAYNAAETIARAIHSAQGQSLRDIEILVVDDGSSDATSEIAAQCSADDERVRIVNIPENRYKPYAMNVGAAQAKGKWIAVLDADDWYAPDRLVTLIAAAEAADVDMIADNQFFVDSVSSKVVGKAFSLQSSLEPLTLDGFLAKSNAQHNFDFGMLKPIFRADFIRKNSITYYEPAKNGHDFYVLLCFFCGWWKGFTLKRSFLSLRVAAEK